MNMQELKMNYNAFIKLKNFVKVNDLSAEIKDYVKKDEIITGNLDVSGTYLLSDLLNTKVFSDEIPFNIIFKDSFFEIIDIDCVDLDYQIIDGRGIEVSFDILVKYETLINEEEVIEIPVLVDETRNELIEEEAIECKSYEEIKEEIELSVDNQINEQLSYIDDNLPTPSGKEEKRKTIKVCYYKDNSELDNVCNSNQVGIDKIFNDNKNTDFVKYRRVIIK